MKEFAECEFVRSLDRRISRVALEPRNLLPSWDDLYGPRQRELQPGRPVKDQTPRPVRPSFDDPNFDVNAFLFAFFELNAFRIPVIVLRPEIENVMRLIGRPVSAGRALAIARELAPQKSRKRGATSREDRTIIAKWRTRLAEKGALIAAQIERKNRISNSSI